MVAEGGLLRFFGAIDGTVLALNISPAERRCWNWSWRYYLGSFSQPYSAAYVEAMVLRYYADIVGEIKRFSDEGRSLFQFREQLRLNRICGSIATPGACASLMISATSISARRRAMPRDSRSTFRTDPRRAAHNSRRGDVERHDRDRRPTALAGAWRRGRHPASKLPHALCPRDHAHRRADDVTRRSELLQSCTSTRFPCPQTAISRLP